MFVRAFDTEHPSAEFFFPEKTGRTGGKAPVIAKDRGIEELRRIERVETYPIRAKLLKLMLLKSGNNC